MEKKDREFRLKCNDYLPEYIMVNGIKYKMSALMIRGSGTYQILYGEFDGNVFNWNKKLLDLTYDIREVIPEKRMFRHGELRDATIYVTNIDDAIIDCVKKLNEIEYEKLDKIISKEDEFKDELTSLLNRYSKENGSNTPDFILANYLMGCLNVFNHTQTEREKWYGRENEIDNLLKLNEEIKTNEKK